MRTLAPRLAAALLAAACCSDASPSRGAELTVAIQRSANIAAQLGDDEKILSLGSIVELAGLTEEQLAPVLSSVANRTVEPMAPYTVSYKTVRASYAQLLDHGHGCDLEIPGFDVAKERAAIERLIFAKGKGGRRVYSPRYLAHLSFERKVAELTDRLAVATKLSERVHLAAQIANVETAWEKDDLRKTFEEALRRYELVVERSRDAFWIKAQDRLLEWTLLHPSDDDGATDTNALLHLDDSKWLKFGFTSTAPGEGVVASAEYQIHRFERPWLERRILTEPCWTWRAPVTPFSGGIISNGLALTGTMNQAKGTLWAVPMGVVVTRNMSFEANGTHFSHKPISLYGVVVKLIQHLP